MAGSASASSVVVGPGSTSTSLVASSPTANVGAKETYTAFVSPTYQGAVSPTGSMSFKNHGKLIHGCASVSVRASAGTASASCTVRYSTSGVRRVTAVYSGDHNFGGSSSSAIAVPVQALGRISSFMLWNFLHTPKYTSVTSMTVNGVSPGTKVIVTCNGKGCPFARRVSALSGGIRCTPTGKHRCGKGPIDLTRGFDRRRLVVGTRVTIEIRRPGWIGKFYSFVVVSGRSPQVHIGCLAPGLSKPGINC
ncbi:MAG TPA: Ig-like domain-containing protein [Solirubrobacteraceae bacterium]